MQTISEEKSEAGKRSLARVGALLILALVAMLVVGFQFVSAYKDDAGTIERADFSEE